MCVCACLCGIRPHIGFITIPSLGSGRPQGAQIEGLRVQPKSRLSQPGHRSPWLWHNIATSLCTVNVSQAKTDWKNCFSLFPWDLMCLSFGSSQKLLRALPLFLHGEDLNWEPLAVTSTSNAEDIEGSSIHRKLPGAATHSKSKPKSTLLASFGHF